MKLITALAVATALLRTHPIVAQSTADSAGVRAAALDYIEGWYAGDPERMQRAVSPELAKRIVRSAPAPACNSRVDQMSAMTLVNGVRNGGGKTTPVEKQRKDVKILDIDEDIASAKVYASDWIDYLQLAKVSGRWQIINVLWATRPVQPTGCVSK